MWGESENPMVSHWVFAADRPVKQKTGPFQEGPVRVS